MIDFQRLETLRAIARLWQDPEALHAMREAAEDVGKRRVLRTKRVPAVRELLKQARAQGLLRG